MNHSDLTTIQRQAWARYHRDAVCNDAKWMELRKLLRDTTNPAEQEEYQDAMDYREDELYDAAWEAFQTSDALRECGVDEETMYQTKGI